MLEQSLRSRRRRAGTVLAGLLAGALASASAAFAAAPNGTYAGDAYGTDANAAAGPVAANLGKTAYINVPCQGTDGQVLKRQVDLLQAGPNGSLFKADTIVDSVYTTESDTTALVRDTSDVERVNLLNGLIRADQVLAVAKTTANASSITSTDTGSKFVGLVVNGNPISATVAPNTEIVISGIGRLVLRQVTRSAGRIVVNMIVLKVEQANSFLPIGSVIIVAHARSGFLRSQTQLAPIGGRAWAASANAKIGKVLQNKIGQAAFVAIGCEGGNNQNTIANISVIPVIVTGTGTTTAVGDPTATNAVARTTATVENVKLLNGRIRATTVKAVAEETFNGNQRTRSTAGSKVVGAVVLGSHVTVQANKKVTLPGIGYVILNEQIVPGPLSNAQTKVNGIHIFVTTINVLGLPVGTEIVVAHADATAGRV